MLGSVRPVIGDAKHPSQRFLIALTVLLIIVAVPIRSQAQNSWVPDFISEAFRSELENGEVYRGHINGGVYADLEFDSGEAYITLVSIGKERDGEQKLSKDGFKIAYTKKDSRIYFESPISSLSLGTLGTISENNSTISFQSVTQGNDVYFHKIVEKPTSGVFLVRAAESDGADDWKITGVSSPVESPLYLDFDSKQAYLVQGDRKFVVYGELPEVEGQSYWLSPSNDESEIFLVMLGFRITSATKLVAVEPSFKSKFLVEGYEFLSEDEFDQLLEEEKKAEEQRLAEEKAAEEKRLAEKRAAEEARKREEARLREEKRRQVAERTRLELEARRVAEQKRREEEAKARDRGEFTSCLKSLESSAPYRPRTLPLLRNEVYEELAQVQSLIQQKEWLKSRNVLDRLIRDDSDLNEYEAANVYNTYAYLMYALENYEKAIDFYQAVLNSKPNIPVALENNTFFTIIQLHLLRGAQELALETTYQWCSKPYTIKESVVELLKGILSTGNNDYELNKLSALVVGEAEEAFDPSEYLPIVKVAPRYPRRAQTREICGSCVVEYTVSSKGTVVDPKVVDGQCRPRGVFENASLKAAAQFKYKPRVVDGVAVPVIGVKNKFTFELEGGRGCDRNVSE